MGDNFDGQIKAIEVLASSSMAERQTGLPKEAFRDITYYLCMFHLKQAVKVKLKGCRVCEVVVQLIPALLPLSALYIF